MTLAPDANLKWVGLNTGRCVLGVTCKKKLECNLPSPLRAMSFFEPDELILYYYGVFAVFAETDA